MMTSVERAILARDPEHGVERHRLDPAPQWTPELKRKSAETSIRISAERIQNPLHRVTMARIIEDAGMVAELGGMYRTLIAENGANYASNAIVWAYEDAQRHNVDLSPGVMTIVQRQIRQNEMRQNRR